MDVMKTTRSRTRRTGGQRRLAALMVLSLCLVVATGLWDQSREAETYLVECEELQARVATLVASAIAARFEVVRADALAFATTDPARHGQHLPGHWPYEGLRVVSAEAPRSPAPTGRLALSVRVSGQRWVDMNVPIASFLAGLSLDEGRWVALRAPNESAFLVSSGRPLDAWLLGSIAAGSGVRRFTPEQAAAVGLPRRVAVAGASSIDAGPLGRWDVVVATGVAGERDRQTRARWRILFAMVLAGGLTLAFGWYAVRTEHKEFGLLHLRTLAELEQEREEQLVREVRAATMRTFAASVAHEITTPLGVIQGRADQLLARFADDPHSADAARRILDQTGRIDSVIRGFLRLARGAGPALERLAPTEVAREAAALVEHRFLRAGVALNSESASRAGGPPIRGDRRLLEHAIVNLLLRACDACERGGSVRLALHHDAASVHFEVEDDGAGVEPELSAQVSEPFLAAWTADRDTGLGLAVAAEIVKVHRGALALAPRKPRGTTAVLCIPIASAVPGEVRRPTQVKRFSEGSSRERSTRWSPP